jgi:hypothetical protein
MKLLRSSLKILANSKVCSASCIRISVPTFLFFPYMIFSNVHSGQFSGLQVAFDKNFLKIHSQAAICVCRWFRFAQLAKGKKFRP